MFFFLFLLVEARIDQHHAINITVDHEYRNIPLLEQAFLYFVDYSREAAKNFLLNALESYDKIDDNTYILETAKKYLDPSAFSLLKTNIQMNSLLPTGEYVKNLPSEYTQQYPTDYVNGKTTKYIYANLHNKNEAELVRDLLKEDSHIILRLNISTKHEENNRMRGFGVRLLPTIASTDSANATEDENNFNDNENKKKGFDDETTKRVETIPSNESSFKPSELYLKIFQYIYDHLNEADILTQLRDITNNWPLYIDDIFNSDVSKEASNFYTEFKKIVKTEWEEVLSINGRSMDIESSDVFTVLSAIKDETKFIKVLQKFFNLTKKEIEEISTKTIEQGTYYFDYRNENITYINDIEKDEQFTKLSPNFADLFTESIVPLVRKNLIELVLYIDPTNYEGFRKLHAPLELLNSGVPVRVGLLPYFNLNDKLSRKVAFAYHHIALRSEKDAYKFLLKVGNYAEQDRKNGNSESFDFTEHQYQKAYYSVNPELHLIDWNDLHRLFSPDTAEYKRLASVQSYYREKGVKTDTISINGRIERVQETAHMYYYYVTDVAKTMKDIISGQDFSDWPQMSNIEILDLEERIVTTLKLPTTSDDFAIGMGIYGESIEKQTEFIRELQQTKWDINNDKTANTYFVLFSKSESDINEFRKFAEGDHSFVSKFAINPQTIHTKKLDRAIRPLVICGGRVFEDLKITQENLKAIEEWYTYSVRTNVISIARNNELLSFYYSTIVCDWLASNIQRTSINSKVFELTNSDLFTYSTNTEEKDDIKVKWQIMMDPFKLEFQSLIDTIRFIARSNTADVELVLNPSKSDKAPRASFNTYYRAAFDRDYVLFTNVHSSRHYFVQNDQPKTWKLDKTEADFNTYCFCTEKLGSPVANAKYRLSSIVVRGNLLKSLAEPAQGVKLSLSKDLQTVVMRDRGFWQFTVNPSSQQLTYTDKSVTQKYFPIREQIDVDSFAFNLYSYQMKTIRGKESFIVGSETEKTAKRFNKEINLFSTVSSLEEEESAYNMIISCLKHTNKKVNFFFLKQFASKDFINEVTNKESELHKKLAKINKQDLFSVNSVDYTMPTWLRPQKNYQKIVKANKMLLLDVLFPLNISRIVFVDPMQTIESDIGQLMNINLGSNAFAFPTFCEDHPNNETKSDRFWHSGFWQQYLRGDMQYFTTDVFVADLDKARSDGLMDIIRSAYQKLSANSQSLSLLDQDLINFAQSKLKIMKLGEEWYWSDHWCQKERRPTAKIIRVDNIVTENEQAANTKAPYDEL